jgi:hypothetical protein
VVASTISTLATMRSPVARYAYLEDQLDGMI